MEIVNLYKYEDSNGFVVTPIKRNDTDIPSGYRLIADDGKALTKDGINLCPAVDTDITEGWYEVIDDGYYEEDDDDYDEDDEIYE